MRSRRARRRLRAAGFQHDNRLAERDLARRRQKRPRVADGFHVNEDAPGVRIVAEPLDQIAPTHIHHGPDRNKRAESDALALAPIENGRSQGAALADERHWAWPRHGARERSVEARMWAHHAHGVWPDEAHRPAPPQDFALQRRSRFTYFPEAGRDNHGPFHA